MNLTNFKVAVIIALAFFNCQIAIGQESETNTNKDYGFSIQYPEDWEVQESNLQLYQVVKFLSTENAPAAISIFIDRIAPITTFYQAASDTDGISIRLIDIANTTLGQLPAVEQTFYQYENDKTVKVQKIHAINNQDLIIIRYITEPQYFDEYLPQFKEMLASFVILS